MPKYTITLNGGQDMASYICAWCGRIARCSIEVLDSGTILQCPECGEATIVDLSKPLERMILLRNAQAAEDWNAAVKEFPALEIKALGEAWRKISTWAEKFFS